MQKIRPGHHTLLPLQRLKAVLSVSHTAPDKNPGRFPSARSLSKSFLLPVSFSPHAWHPSLLPKNHLRHPQPLLFSFRLLPQTTDQHPPQAADLTSAPAMNHYTAVKGCPSESPALRHKTAESTLPAGLHLHTEKGLKTLYFHPLRPPDQTAIFPHPLLPADSSVDIHLPMSVPLPQAIPTFLWKLRTSSAQKIHLPPYSPAVRPGQAF